MQSLRLAVVQLTSIDDFESNLSVVLESTKKGIAAQADLIVFPENSLYLRLSGAAEIEAVGPDSFKPIVDLIQGTTTHVLITTPTRSEQKKLRNSTWLIAPDGGIEELYSKIHLFDVDVEGAPPVRESDGFVHGMQPRLWTFKGWNIGLCICYDLRFAELFLSYAQKADLILVPSAFLVPTGKAHWHVLLRARATECQAFVAAPAQGGEHISKRGGRRETFGHSLVADPWGRVLVDMANSGVQVVELDKALITKTRQQIPMGSHRRLKST